jgi:hypothetical protein
VAIRATVLSTSESFTYEADAERVLRHLLRKLERWNTKEPSADEPPVLSLTSDADFHTLPRQLAQMLAHDIAYQHEDNLGDLARALQAALATS